MIRFDRWYARILRLAPPAFRERYGREMTTMAAARLAEPSPRPRLFRAAIELVDLTRTIAREHRRGRGGDASRPSRGGRDGGWLVDVRSALAGLRRQRGLTALAATILAVGLGAATLGFGLMSSVVMRPLPYGDAGELVMIWGFVPQIQAGFPEVPIHGVRVRQYRDAISGVRGLEGFKAEVFNLDIDGRPDSERVNGLLTTAGLFDTLRVAPAAGRFFDLGDDVDGAACRVVIGYGLWQRRFGGDPTVISRAVRLNDRACTIAGVAPRGFDFPRGGEMPASFQFPNRTEIWVASPPPSRGPSDLALLARREPSTTTERLQAEFDTLAAQQTLAQPASRGWNSVRVVPLSTQAVPRSIAISVWALFAAVIGLLLVAAGNAAQLLILRGAGRRADFAVCAALGASPARLVRAVVLEIAMTTTIAALAGAGLATVAIAAVRTYGPERFPRLAEAALDPFSFLFLAGASFVAMAIVALGPALLARRAGLHSALHAPARGGSGQLRPARSALVFVQVAFAVVLVTTSALLLRSLTARLAIDPGFDASHSLAFEVTLPATTYPEILRGAMPASRPQIVAAIEAVLTRLRAIPGVTSAAMGKPLPMSGAQEASVFIAEKLPAPKRANEVPIAEYIVVSDDFARTIGASLVDGREFNSGERETSEPVAVINDVLARQLSVAGPPLAQRLKLGGTMKSPAPWLTVVGVIKDMKRYGLDDAAGPAMYVHYSQGGYPTLATVPFVVRTSSSDPMALLTQVKAAVRDAGVSVPVAGAETMSLRLARVTADTRFATLLVTAFAMSALLLAVAGLYGTVAFAVSQRRRELGIRTALGARPDELIRLVLADGVRPAAWAAAAGLITAALAASALGGVLHGISPADPITFAGVPIVLVLVVGAACFLPARRAAAVDPRETLR